MSKMLLIFCDGTGMDGNLSHHNHVAQSTEGDVNAVRENTDIPAMIPSQTPGSENDNKHYPTNVIRLARSVKSQTADGKKKQIVFYQSGVGSEADFTGISAAGTLMLKAMGTTVASKIRDAYAFLAQNFEDGDEICIFGFSRGAYTARKLSGLIDRIGLLPRRNLGQFFLIWSQLVKHKTPTIPSDTRHPRIKCVGVWDTVGSVDSTIDALAIKDTSLPVTVDIALHALALHENREKFLPTLWTTPQSELAPNQTLKQVWFPGAHSDVGGGYERRELADIALFWMVGEIKSFIELDLEFLRSTRQHQPEPWGTSQPTNEYMNCLHTMRAVFGCKTRLESKLITKHSTFHQSLAVSPQVLKSPDNMTTTIKILKALGSGFNSQYAPLNEFEAYCKNNWKNTRMGTLDPAIFGSPRDVIPPPAYWTAESPQGFVPSAAIQGGHESKGAPLYIARAPYEAGIRKASIQNKSVYIGYNHKEIAISAKYEFLVGDESSVRWILIDGPLTTEKLGGAVAVCGGSEADGAPLYIAQAAMKGGVQCGKVRDNNTAKIPYGGSEIDVKTYNVLVFA
ncbi:hypothetical protein EV702DRAFT_1202478 [Suillus placidus]|uniref:T6SS Phospholipase effector Tle1-like catalytic domain-containing protein n=1 Tax=Suillus placidus TaxID=48579 RepID=A0A9P6ZL11_9AGAM|nr:hypothetical protein EV702DRAFT_1202478 [Suillus placidus]